MMRKIIILLYILILSIQIPQEKTILCFGYTQTGKSSLIKYLTGDDSIVVGEEGLGESTTNTINIYRVLKPKLSIKLIFMDTIGLGDNTLKFNTGEIRQIIQNKILQYSNHEGFNQIHGIIITESLKDSANQLRNVLKQISQIFGELPNESIIVVGTKANDVKQKSLIEKRQMKIKQIMQDFGISQDQYVRFITPYQFLKQKDLPQYQNEQLQAVINKCKPFNSALIQKKYQKIIARANQIQIKNTTTKMVGYTQFEQKQVGCTGFFGFIRTIFGCRQKYYDKHEKVRSEKNIPDHSICYFEALKQFEKNSLTQIRLTKKQQSKQL